MNNLPHIEAAVTRAAAFVQATWQQAVMGAIEVPGARPLKVNIALRKLYADNIVLNSQIAGQGSVAQRVAAVKQIAKDLEHGKGPWDMKEMLLRGPKARVSKKGNRYNIIPFRHGVPTTSGNAWFNSTPQSIYEKARKLKATTRQGNGTAWGERLKSHFGTGINVTTGYEHKAPIHEGMVRIEKTYARATQSKYLTFRVVSDKSDPLSWWHPGYPAHHIAEAVTNFCQPAVEAMIREAAIDDLVDVGTLSVGMTINRG